MSTPPAIFFWPLAAFGFTALGIWWLLRSGIAQRLATDHPTSRSMHTEAVPRSGGVVIVFALFLWSLPVADGITLVVGMALILSTLSFIDDRYGLPILPRLLTHLVCAAISLRYLVPGIEGGALILGILLLVWTTNLFNFMDGSNGLAGGTAVIGFGFLGTGFFLSGQSVDAGLCWIVSMASLGFLIFNAGVARIFMGDGGSIPLGFMAGLYSIGLYQLDKWMALGAILVFSPFLVDASLTVLWRAMKGEPFWRSHRDHAYQRLIRMGWSHQHVAYIYHATMLIACTVVFLTSAFAVDSGVFAMLVISFWLALMIVIYLLIDRHWSAKAKKLTGQVSSEAKSH